MAKEIRLAVVGFGRGGGLFNLAVKGFEGIVPVAACDTAPAKLEVRMTLPGIYAAESARKSGELIRIQYPWLN